MYPDRNNGQLIQLFYNEYCTGYDPNAVPDQEEEEPEEVVVEPE